MIDDKRNENTIFKTLEQTRKGNKQTLAIHTKNLKLRFRTKV